MRVFGGVFRRWIERRLTAPSPALSRALARLAWREERDEGEPLDELRKAAWNLAEWRDFDAPWDKRAFDRDARLAALIEQAEAVSCAIAARSARCAVRGLAAARGIRAARATRARGRPGRRRPVEERTAAPARRDALGARTASTATRLGSVRGVGGTEGRRSRLPAAGRCGPGRAPARRTLGGGGAVPGGEEARGAARLHGPAAAARATCCATTARAPTCSASTSASSSMSFRTPTRCRPRSCCCWRRPTRRARLAQGAARARQALRGGRPEAIDLPLPPRRRAAVPAHLPRAARRGVGARGADAAARARTQAIQSFVNAAFEHTIANYLPLEGGIDGPAAQPAIVALPMP